MAHLAAIMGIHGVSSSEWLPSNQSQSGNRCASDGTILCSCTAHSTSHSTAHSTAQHTSHITQHITQHSTHHTSHITSHSTAQHTSHSTAHSTQHTSHTDTCTYTQPLHPSNSFPSPSPPEWQVAETAARPSSSAGQCPSQGAGDRE